MENGNKLKLLLSERDCEARERISADVEKMELFEMCYICRSESEIVRSIPKYHPDVVFMNSRLMFSFLSSCEKSVEQKLKDEKLKRERIKRDATKKLLQIGFPTRGSAFSYTIDSVAFMVEHRGGPCSIVKDVYETVADGHQTTAVCVESAIRKTIHRVCKKREIAMGENAEKLPGQTAKKVSNSEFLSAIVHEIIIKMEN